MSDEASNGSNIHVDLKTSLFEVVKNNFADAVKNDPDILKVEPRRTVKARTKEIINAEVENIIDITMNKNGHTHKLS